MPSHFPPLIGYSNTVARLEDNQQKIKTIKLKSHVSSKQTLKILKYILVSTESKVNLLIAYTGGLYSLCKLNGTSDSLLLPLKCSKSASTGKFLLTYCRIIYLYMYILS